MWAERRRKGLARFVVSSSRPDIVRHDVVTPHWQLPPLRAACLSDIHVAEPWMGLRALERIVDEIHACKPDIIFLLGDYIASLPVLGRRPETRAIAGVLGGLKARLGVHAILGNHDRKDDALERKTNGAENGVIRSLIDVDLPPLINVARQVDHGEGLWLVGLDTQQGVGGRKAPAPRHDPVAAFRDVPIGAQTLVLAHEPDWFAAAHPGAPIQLSGHTHGGQVNLWGRRPLTPSAFGDRYAYGHIVEDGRHLVVSGGAGYTLAPMRINQPPEVTLVTFRSACGYLSHPVR